MHQLVKKLWLYLNKFASTNKWHYVCQSGCQGLCMTVWEIFIYGYLLRNCDTRICSSEYGIVTWKFCSKNFIDIEASFCKVNTISDGMDLFLNPSMCLVCIFRLSGTCSFGRQLEPRYITCSEGTHQSVGGKEPGDNARDSKVKVLLVHVV